MTTHAAVDTTLTMLRMYQAARKGNAQRTPPCRRALAPTIVTWDPLRTAGARPT